MIRSIINMEIDVHGHHSEAKARAPPRSSYSIIHFDCLLFSQASMNIKGVFYRTGEENRLDGGPGRRILPHAPFAKVLSLSVQAC